MADIFPFHCIAIHIPSLHLNAAKSHVRRILTSVILVFAGSFGVFALSIGIMKSFGVLFVELSRIYDAPASVLASSQSLCSCLHMALGKHFYSQVQYSIICRLLFEICHSVSQSVVSIYISFYLFHLKKRNLQKQCSVVVLGVTIAQ